MDDSRSVFADRSHLDLDLPIHTERLTLRAATADVVDAVFARRNEPMAAEFQSWTVPYPRQRVVELLDDLVTMVGPTLGKWWMVMVDEADGTRVGDVAVHLDESGSIAEIGYNIASSSWGRGYATEAAGAVIDALFARHRGLTRLQARMHPDNLASAVVAERCGLVYEGQTRLSFVPQDSTQKPSDDRLYGMVRDDWVAWNRRPTGHPERVQLVEITVDNVNDVTGLTTHRSQRHLVASVVESLAHAQVAPTGPDGGARPWYRAVEADGELVGFVMLAAPSRRHPEPYLWRLLIDRRHQRRGIGRRVLDLVVDQACQWGGTTLTVSWVPGPGSPESFYLDYGFVPTGPADGSGEIPAELALTAVRSDQPPS